MKDKILGCLITLALIWNFIPLNINNEKAVAETTSGPPDSNKTLFVFPTDTNYKTDASYSQNPNQTDSDGTYSTCTAPGTQAWIPWTADQAAAWQTAVTNDEPLLRQLLGAPFSNYDGSSAQNKKICVVHNPLQKEAGWNNTKNQIVLRDPSTTYSTTAISTGCFLHEWTHKFFGDSGYQGTWMGDLFAQLTEVYVGERLGFDDVHVMPDTPDYDLYNNPYYSQDLLSSNAIDPIYQKTYYTISPVILIKISEQYPTAISDYDTRVYKYWKDNSTVFNGYDPSTYNLFIQLMTDTLQNMGDGTVEGEPFADWIMKQNTFAQTVGTKFGVRFGQEQRSSVTNARDGGQNKVVVRFGYFTAQDEFVGSLGADLSQAGTVTYGVYGSQGNKLFDGQQAGLVLGDSGLIDLTAKIKEASSGVIPTGKVCVVADLQDGNGTKIVTGRSSCYYLRGDEANYAHIGITGSIGNSSNINMGGSVTVTPMQGQSVSAETIPINNGGFMSSALTAPSFAAASGLFKIEYAPSSGPVITKYVVKTKNDFLYVNIPIQTAVPVLQSLTSDAISGGSSTIKAKTNGGIVAINLNRTGTTLAAPPRSPIVQYCKYLNENANYSISLAKRICTGSTSGSLSLASTDKYSINLLSTDGRILQKGPDISFGSPSTGGVSVYKNSSVSGPVTSGNEIRYDMIVNNPTSTPATGAQFTDPIPAGTTYKPNSATVNGSAVTDAADGDAFSSPGGVPTWNFGTMTQNSNYVSLIVTVN